MKLTFLIVLLACVFAVANAGYIVVFGQNKTVATLDEKTGATEVIGSFDVKPPAQYQHWVITTLKAIDQGKQLLFFSFEDVTYSSSSILAYDLITKKTKQGPIFPFRLRTLFFDSVQKRMFAMSDYEQNVADSALLEIDTETLGLKRVIANLNQYGSVSLAATYDQKRGLTTFTMFNFTEDVHRLVTVDTRTGRVVYSPVLRDADWHFLTLAWDENTDKLLALWNYNNYAPLYLKTVDRQTARFLKDNVTIIDWKDTHDSMTTDAIPFAKDSVHGNLFALISSKNLNQYLVLIDLKEMKVAQSKLLQYPDVVGFDITAFYVVDAKY